MNKSFDLFEILCISCGGVGFYIWELPEKYTICEYCLGTRIDSIPFSEILY